MILTKHAKARQRQRGMSDFLLNIIEQNGRIERAQGGAIKIFFGKREHQRIMEQLKKARQLVDKAKNGTIIMKDNYILTVYKSTTTPRGGSL